MTPKQYARDNNKSLSVVAEAAKAIGFSKCSKPALSLASDPLTGVVAHPELKKMFRGNHSAKRSKPCKHTFRLDKTVHDTFRDAMQRHGHATVQEAVEYAVRLYIVETW
jgi:hypothetical protein